MINRFAKSPGFWIGVAVVGVVAVGIVLSAVYWDWLQRGIGNSNNAESVRNIALVLGGVAAILMALWRSLVAERQATVAQKQSETAERAYVNERYRQAASMLGDRELPVRLGGVLALERLAGDHPTEFRREAEGLLTEFVRSPPALQEPQPKVSDGWPPVERPAARQDVQRAIAAIVKLRHIGSSKEDGVPIPLGGLDLRNAQLCSIDMEGLWLRGANLQNANLMYARLTGADLKGAELQFANCRHARFSIADLSGCDMSDADFSGVSAMRTKFKGATMPATMVDALLSEADCTEAQFINTDLSEAQLDSANLTGARFASMEVWMSAYGQHVAEPGALRITQIQLDAAVADPERPPDLRNLPLMDECTGRQLVWRGRSPESDASEDD